MFDFLYFPSCCHLLFGALSTMRQPPAPSRSTNKHRTARRTHMQLYPANVEQSHTGARIHVCTSSVHTHPLACVHAAVRYTHVHVQTQPISCVHVIAHTYTTYRHTHPLFWGHSALRNTPTCLNTPPVPRAHAHMHTQTCIFGPGRCMYMHTQPIFSTEAHKHTHTALPHPSPPSYMHLQAGSTCMPLPGHARYQHIPVFLPVGESGLS